MIYGASACHNSCNALPSMLTCGRAAVCGHSQPRHHLDRPHGQSQGKPLPLCLPAWVQHVLAASPSAPAPDHSWSHACSVPVCAWLLSSKLMAGLPPGCPILLSITQSAARRQRSPLTAFTPSESAAQVVAVQGFAYIEFLEADAVASAVLLSDTELHGRALKVIDNGPCIATACCHASALQARATVCSPLSASIVLSATCSLALFCLQAPQLIKPAGLKPMLYRAYRPSTCCILCHLAKGQTASE